MKEIVKITLGFCFFIIIMFIAGAAESNKWGWALLFMGIFALICFFVNYLYTEKENNKINTMNFKETIPAQFLENVMAALIECINTKEKFSFIQDELEVRNIYFIGKTLCIDVKDIDGDNDWEGVITIGSDYTCGWFNSYGFAKDTKIIRDKLSPIEIDMYKELYKNKNNKESI